MTKPSLVCPSPVDYGGFAPRGGLKFLSFVELKHVLGRITYAARAADVTGDLGGNIAALAYQAIALGYSEDQELEADAWSCRQLMEMGGDRTEFIAFIEKMEAQDGHTDEGAGEQDSFPGAVDRQIQNHFRSRPPTKTRVENLKQIDL